MDVVLCSELLGQVSLNGVKPWSLLIIKGTDFQTSRCPVNFDMYLSLLAFDLGVTLQRSYSSHSHPWSLLGQGQGHITLVMLEK